MLRSDPTRTRPATRAVVTLAVVLLALLATPARAQLGNTLPSDIILAPRPSSAQVEAIRQYIATHAESALSDDFTASRRAHEGLEQPLGTPGLTVGFRQAYAEAVMPVVDRLLASDDASHRAAGVRIAGAVATDTAVNRLLDVVQGDDQGLTLFAVTRLGRTLETLRRGNARGPTESGAMRTIDALGAVVESAKDPVIADAAVRSLAVATELDAIELPAVRDHALAVLGERAATRARGQQINARNPQPELLVLLRACGVARASILEPNAIASQEASRGAVALGAAAIGLVTRRLEADRIGRGDRRGVDLELLRAGESLLYYARDEHAQASGRSPGSVQRTELAATLERGDERAFRTQARTLVGPASELVETFRFTPADRFLP